VGVDIEIGKTPTAGIHHTRCSASIQTDMSVTINELCMNEDWHCAVQEFAEHEGISVSPVPHIL
jgi:hypothetical protein